MDRPGTNLSEGGLLKFRWILKRNIQERKRDKFHLLSALHESHRHSVGLCLNKNSRDCILVFVHESCDSLSIHFNIFHCSFFFFFDITGRCIVLNKHMALYKM